MFILVRSQLNQPHYYVIFTLATESLITKLGLIYIFLSWDCLLLLLIFDKSLFIPSQLISLIDLLTVVRAGVTNEEIGLSSNPTREISLGIFNLSSEIAFIAPTAISSLEQNTAVGTCSKLSSFFIAL